jgi:hypothetical protein
MEDSFFRQMIERESLVFFVGRQDGERLLPLQVSDGGSVMFLGPDCSIQRDNGGHDKRIK